MSLSAKLKACSLGATAILTEIVSMRLMGLCLGQGSFAINLSLALFFAGMALGACAAEAIERNRGEKLKLPLVYPLLALVGSQVTIALATSGIVLPSAPFACLIALVIPAFASTFVLPFLSENSDTDERNINYCLYNLGGTLAALFAMLFLPALGMTKTITLAIALSLMVLVKLPRGKSGTNAPAPVTMTTESQALPKPGQKRLLVAALAVALSLMLMEASSARLLAVFLGSGHLGLSITITLVLAGLTLGNLSGMARAKSKLPLLAPLTLLTLSLCLSLLTLGALPLIFQSLRQILPIDIACLCTAALLILPSSYFYGNIFPLLTKRLSAADAWTRIYFANLLGSASAVVIFPFILQNNFLPFSPSALENVFRLNIFVALAVAALQVRKSSEGYRLLSACSIAGLILVFIIASFAKPINVKALAGGLPFLPGGLQTLGALSEEGRNEKILYFCDGAVSSVLLTTNETLNSYTLKCDGKIEAQAPLFADLPSRAHEETHIDLGALPFLFCPQSKDILLIGLGGGTTADTISQIAPSKENLQVCEIEPCVIEANKFLGKAAGEKVASDARIFLQSTKKKFDLVIAQPGEPWLTGSASLYTREYLELLKSRLKPSGIVCQWLNLYGLKSEYLASFLKTYHSVFANILVYERKEAGEIIILAGQAPFALESVPAHFVQLPLRKALARARLGSYQEMAQNFRLDQKAVEKLCSSIRGSDLVTDDNNLLANTSIREIYQGEETIATNKQLLCRFAASPLALGLPAHLPAGLIDPLDREALLARASTLREAEAGKLLRRLACDYANDLEIRLRLARLLLSTGDFGAALKESQLALFINEDAVEAHCLGAIAWLYLNDEENAKALLKKARQKTPLSVILKLIDGILTTVHPEPSAASGGPPVQLGIKEVQASVSSVRSKLMELVR